MPIDFSVPPLDDSAAEVLVERFLQPLGARVEPGQPLAIVATPSFEWELPATTAGTIANILAEPGTTVGLGAPLLVLEADAATDSCEQPAELQPLAAYRATPLAQRMATAHGLDLAAVTGTGAGGRIMQRDVLKLLPLEQAAAINSEAIAHQSPATHTHDSPGNVAETGQLALSHERGRTSRPAPSVITPPTLPVTYTWLPYAVTAIDIEMTALEAFVARHAPRMSKRGVRLDALACVAHGVVGALHGHRLLNSAWSEDGIVVWGRVRLAVARHEHGFTEPVLLKNAADLSVQGIARKLQQPDEPFTGSAATFVLATSTASWWSTALLAASCAAALSIGPTQPRVVLQNAADTIVLRRSCLAALSYDARVIAQPQADAFLSALKQRLEHFASI